MIMASEYRPDDETPVVEPTTEATTEPANPATIIRTGYDQETGAYNA